MRMGRWRRGPGHRFWGPTLSACASVCACAELWAQGERERGLGLPLSPLCDRAATCIPSSQLGFLSGVVVPSWQLLGQLDPRVAAIGLQHVDTNTAHYEQLLAKGRNAFQ